MKFFLIPCCLRTRRRLLTAAAALPIALAAGCASPGPPQPPSLNLPQPVKDLTTERIGNVVHLRWTTPAKTTDRIDVKGAMTAEICRIEAPPATPPATPSTPATSTPAPSCASVARLAVQPGPSQSADTLPALLTVDPAVLLAYRVQILNVHNRSAGPSPEAFAAGGAAPPPVEQLNATLARNGILLKWQHASTPAQVELDRIPMAPDGTFVEPASKTSAKSPKSSTRQPKKPSATSQTPTSNPHKTTPASTEIKLRTPLATPSDPGGTLDSTTQIGETYRYVAQRVLSVTLGGHKLELRSAISPPVTIVMRDIFPPAAPTGLEAVPGGTTAADRSIDLSWTPDTEVNLAGYSVYRQEINSQGVATGTAARLNPIPVVGPAFRDQTAMAGHRYAYRVTAVDTAGNESAPSDSVQETLREQ